MTKNLEFIVPSFFPKEQLFGMEINHVKGSEKVKEQVVFIRNGQNIVQLYENPKLKAKQLSNKINGLKTKDCVVRMTFRDSILQAYVVINKNNSKQKAWALTKKTARIIKEKKLGIAPSKKTLSLIEKGMISI